MDVELIVSIIGIVVTIVIAYFGEKLNIKLSNNSDKLKSINNRLRKRLNDISEHSSILKAIPHLSLTNKPNRVVIKSEFGQPLNTVSLRLNGTLKLEYGRISQVFICWKDQLEDDNHNFNYDIIWNSHQKELTNTVDLDKIITLAKPSIGQNDTLCNHFYLIIVDEAKVIHRLLVEVISDTYGKSNGSNRISVNLNDIKEARMDYRVFDDNELLVYSKLCLKKPWININGGNEETNFKKTPEEQDEWLKLYNNLSQMILNNELRSINKHFALVGLA